MAQPGWVGYVSPSGGPETSVETFDSLSLDDLHDFLAIR